MPNENPFQDPLRFERQVPECVIVIFGANGDLTKRKLLPALYRLAFDRRLSAGFAIVGISRTPLSDDDFREKMRASVEQFSEDTKLDDDVWAAFARGLFYVSGDIGDAGLYQRLGEKLAQIEGEAVERGKQLALGQVAVGAEDDDDTFGTLTFETERVLERVLDGH